MNKGQIIFGVGVVCILIWWAVRKFSKPKSEPRTVNTAYGTFTQHLYDTNGLWWEADFAEAGEHVTLSVRDKEGIPDQDLLDRIPGLARLVKESDKVARTALREEYEDLDPFPTFHLSSVDLKETKSFELHYSTDPDQAHDFSVFLTIEDGKVTDILLVD